MKLALIGRGNMGRRVADLAAVRGHEIGVVLTSKDSKRSLDDMAGLLRSHGAAIDFSVGSAVADHAAACARAGVALVEGTTGWADQLAHVEQTITKAGGALVYGANFSVVVNLFYRLVARAGELFGSLEGVDAFIEEEHHAKKRDAPSGTALRLRDILGRKAVPIASTRAGAIPGTHRVGFDGPADHVTLEHVARSRDGFAIGALLAADWIVGRRGVFRFEDVLDDMMASARTTP